ncbi:MAG: hypothetical protein AAB110_07000 [Candidatus Desantisbacteria bacterium]
MAGISPISGAGGGVYNAYLHPAMHRVNMPRKAVNIDPLTQVNPINVVQPQPENGKTAAGWAINSFKSILNFFSDSSSMKKNGENNASEIQTQCLACRNREYTCSNGETSDGSKTIIQGHESAERVRQHEAEHLKIARMNAATQGKLVVAQRINTITEKCPECGETYTAKGEAITETVKIAAKQPVMLSSATYNPSSNHPNGADLRFHGIGRLFDGYG